LENKRKEVKENNIYSNILYNINNILNILKHEKIYNYFN